MADNDLKIENNTEEILVDAQEEQISVGETNTDITIDAVASLVVNIEDSVAMSVAVQEVSSVPSGTRIVVNHTTSDPNQHTIGAITGLRAELDYIESLKTVYSSGVNVANYYKWEGDNAHDTYGYFVSLVPGTSTIKIYDGADELSILGVSVDAAGFIGGQDETVLRDNKYGLIVSSGLVGVRCELDVNIGDCVVSNTYGYAKKTGSNYGYRVLTRENKDGVEYAVIALGVQADMLNELGIELAGTQERVDANYTNIISAVNVAHQAYNKASEIEVSNQIMSGVVDEAVERVDGMAVDVENLTTQVSNSVLVSVQAKAVAESAATSAESMRNEAVEKANEALAEAAQTREDVEQAISEMETDLDNAGLELQATKEELQLLKDEMKPLAQWESADGAQSSFAGFVAKSDADSATLADMVEWRGTVEDGSIESIAGVKRVADENKAELDAVASYSKDGKTGLAGLSAYVDENTATTNTLAKYSCEETGRSGIAGLVSEVDNSAATLSLVADYSGTDENGNTFSGLAGLRAQVDANKSELSNVVSYEYKDDDGDVVSKGLAGLVAQTDASKSEVQALTSWQDQTNIALTSIKQKSDANGASISLTAANIDKYRVGPHSQAYGFTLEQARDVLEEGMVYVPSEDTEEIYDCGVDADGNKVTYTKIFSNEFYYVWEHIDNLDGIEAGYMWNEYGTVSNPPVYPGGIMPAGDAYSLWYTNSDTVTEGYEPYTLYKYGTYETVDDDGNATTESHWEPVATLKGNSQSRAVSQIRQDANSIIAEVTDARGDAASLGIRVTDTEAEVQSLALWSKGGEEDGEQYNLATIKQTADEAGASIAQVVESIGEDGEVSAASIVTAINNGEPSVVIEAEHVALNGYVTISSLEKDGTTKIDGARITTGIIQSDGYKDENETVYSDTGTCFNLDNGSLTSEQFAIDSNGNAYFNGTLSANTVSAINIDASQVTTPDLNAFGATIGGWKIDSDKIHKGAVGMSSGNDDKYASLVSDEDSSIRFYSGETLITETDTLLFTSSGETLTKTIVMSDEEQSSSYKFVEAKCLTTEYNHEGQINKTVSVALKDFWVNESGKYCATIDGVDLFSDLGFEPTAYTVSTVGTFTFTSNGVTATATVTDLGDGSVNVVIESDEAKFLSLTLKASYEFDETLDINVEHDNTTITVTFNAQVLGIEYSIDIEYVTNINNYKFKVLEDGSLYASAADIEGDIRASGGRIGKILVTDNGLQINDKNANIDIGNLSMCCDDDKTALLKTSGALKIVGSDEAAIELMTNKYVDEQELMFNLYAYKDEEFVYLYVQTEGDVIPYCPIEVVVDWEEWIIDNPNTLAQSGSLCFEMSSSRSAIESIKYTQDGAISLRFNGSEEDTNIIDLDITNTVSKMDASIDNIPLTRPDAQINIVGDIVPAETATLTNDGLTASGYNLGYKDWSDDSDSNINNRYWAWIFATKMRLASSAHVGGNLTVSGTINGEVVGDSDRNKKNTIAPFSDAYDMIFDALKPVSYRFNSDLTNLTHTGLIAQDVKEAVEDAGLTIQDFAGYCEWKNDNGNLECGLRYSEFIALCVDQIQKLKKRVEELEEKLNNTK